MYVCRQSLLSHPLQGMRMRWAQNWRARRKLRWASCKSCWQIHTLIFLHCLVSVTLLDHMITVYSGCAFPAAPLGEAVCLLWRLGGSAGWQELPCSLCVGHRREQRLCAGWRAWGHLARTGSLTTVLFQEHVRNFSLNVASILIPVHNNITTLPSSFPRPFGLRGIQVWSLLAGGTSPSDLAWNTVPIDRENTWL